MATITSHPDSQQQAGGKPLRDFRQEVTDNIIRMRKTAWRLGRSLGFRRCRRKACR